MHAVHFESELICYPTSPSYYVGVNRVLLHLFIYLKHMFIALIITIKCTYIKFHIKTLKIAPTCFDPKIILRELRCSLLKLY